MTFSNNLILVYSSFICFSVITTLQEGSSSSSTAVLLANRVLNWYLSTYVKAILVAATEQH